MVQGDEGQDQVQSYSDESYHFRWQKQWPQMRWMLMLKAWEAVPQPWTSGYE